MELDIVNYDTAQLLKRMGFNEPTGYRYVDGDEGTFYSNDGDDTYSNQIPIEQYTWCLAPTQALVQQWLREVHDIVVSVDYSDDDTYFISLSMIPFKNITISGLYPTYQQALEAGILEAIEVLTFEEPVAEPQVNMPFVDWLGFNYPMMKNHGGTMNIHQIDRVFEEYKKVTA